VQAESVDDGPTKSLSDLIATHRTMDHAQTKEFRYMLMALFVEYMSKHKLQTFKFTKLRLNNNELVSLPDAEEGIIFERAVGLPKRGIELVCANIMKEGDPISCHMQAVVFVINHERHSVAYLVNPASVVIARETINRFIQSTLQYTVRAPPGPVPSDCRDISQSEVFWPFLTMALEVFNPDAAEKLNTNANVCIMLQNFVDEMVATSKKPGVDDGIRTAYTQIHIMQEKLSRCNSNPSNEECRKSTWNVEALQKAQKEFSKGNYLTVYQMCSQIQHANVAKQHVAHFFQEIHDLSTTSALPSDKMTHTLSRRNTALQMRAGCTKTSPAHALSVLL